MTKWLLYVATWAAQQYVVAKGLITSSNATLLMWLAIFSALAAVILLIDSKRIKQKILKSIRRSSRKLKQIKHYFREIR